MCGQKRSLDVALSPYFTSCKSSGYAGDFRAGQAAKK
jgi:hypothetical protein